MKSLVLQIYTVYFTNGLIRTGDKMKVDKWSTLILSPQWPPAYESSGPDVEAGHKFTTLLNYNEGKGVGRIDWIFLRRFHLVVFLDPYFLGVNACISMSWRILTDKHTPCCRLPSHTSAARIWSRRSRAQYPRRGEHQHKMSEKYNKSWKLTLTRGLKPPSTSSILAQAWRKPGVNFKRNPCVQHLGFIHDTLRAFNIASSFVCNHTCKWCWRSRPKNFTDRSSLTKK